MSYVDVGAMISSAVEALVNAFNAVIGAISANIGPIISLVVTGSILYGVFRLVRRYTGTFTRWITGLF